MRYVALLRGINVGGKNKIPMERLREVAASIGFENVKTYVNSGNLAFDAKKADDKRLEARLRDAIEREFGMNISVMVRSSDEIAGIVANNPFVGQFDNHKYFHVFFLDRELSNNEKKLLMEQANENEMISVDGRTIYYLLRISILDSALGKGFIDRKLKIPATGRNWRTVETIAAL
ncbi:MAG TPA: DUF1697 domain-containing protein [Pyrinomonadaceae bacterium]|nr:DUF1697 domain-containing protein [Pyrinomonadaceae bacterium]